MEVVKEMETTLKLWSSAMQDVKVSTTIIEPPKACPSSIPFLLKFPDNGPVIPTPGVPTTEPPPKVCVLTLVRTFSY